MARVVPSLVVAFTILGVVVCVSMLTVPGMAVAAHAVWHQPSGVANNPYDPNSVNNPYGGMGVRTVLTASIILMGRFGSPYSPDSVNNPYGPYYNPSFRK